MSSKSVNINNLFTSAQNEGILSANAMQALNIPDLGAQIQAGLGLSADDVTASEVMLVSFLIDDSGSIRMVAGNSQAVREGHNLVLDALSGSKQENNILVGCRYLNGTDLYDYCLLSQAVRMDTHNYDPRGGTPLYDQSIVVCGRQIAKAQEFADNGVPVRTGTVIVTDGKDEHSRRSAQDVYPIVRDMLMQENHIVAGMGIDDGTGGFRGIFKEMGIPDEWILTPRNTPSEIRKAFGAFSKSMVRASQSAGSFSQTAAGGFGQP